MVTTSSDFMRLVARHREGEQIHCVLRRKNRVSELEGSQMLRASREAPRNPHPLADCLDRVTGASFKLRDVWAAPPLCAYKKRYPYACD